MSRSQFECWGSPRSPGKMIPMWYRVLEWIVTEKLYRLSQNALTAAWALEHLSKFVSRLQVWVRTSSKTKSSTDWSLHVIIKGFVQKQGTTQSLEGHKRSLSESSDGTKYVSVRSSRGNPTEEACLASQPSRFYFDIPCQVFVYPCQRYSPSDLNVGGGYMRIKHVHDIDARERGSDQ